MLLTGPESDLCQALFITHWLPHVVETIDEVTLADDNTYWNLFAKNWEKCLKKLARVSYVVYPPYSILHTPYSIDWKRYSNLERLCLVFSLGLENWPLLDAQASLVFKQSVSEGRLAPLKWLNFWRNFKLPLTPPLHFRIIIPQLLPKKNLQSNS